MARGTARLEKTGRNENGRRYLLTVRSSTKKLEALRKCNKELHKQVLELTPKLHRPGESNPCTMGRHCDASRPESQETSVKQ